MSKPAVWKPASDDELMWFRAGGRLAAHPRPLDYTFEVYALAWGITRALESLYFPFYELRSRVVDGDLYFASVPSAFAERDLDAQLGRMRDSGLRFTRNIRGTWVRAIKREVVGYNEVFAAFPPPNATNSELADQLNRLRRTRGNQWFAATRAVFGPVAMLEQAGGPPRSDDAQAVVAEAGDLLQVRGSELLENALTRVGDRLVHAGAILRAEDVHMLDHQEVRDALRDGGDMRARVAERVGAVPYRDGHESPALLGRELSPDAPRMYLLREVLALVS
jgi:hypothetical protein